MTMRFHSIEINHQPVDHRIFTQPAALLSNIQPSIHSFLTPTIEYLIFFQTFSPLVLCQNFYF